MKVKRVDGTEFVIENEHDLILFQKMSGLIEEDAEEQKKVLLRRQDKLASTPNITQYETQGQEELAFKTQRPFVVKNKNLIEEIFQQNKPSVPMRAIAKKIHIGRTLNDTERNYITSIAKSFGYVYVKQYGFKKEMPKNDKLDKIEALFKSGKEKIDKKDIVKIVGYQFGLSNLTDYAHNHNIAVAKFVMKCAKENGYTYTKYRGFHKPKEMEPVKQGAVTEQLSKTIKYLEKYIFAWLKTHPKETTRILAGENGKIKINEDSIEVV